MILILPFSLLCQIRFIGMSLKAAIRFFGILMCWVAMFHCLNFVKEDIVTDAISYVLDDGSISAAFVHDANRCKSLKLLDNIDILSDFIKAMFVQIQNFEQEVPSSSVPLNKGNSDVIYDPWSKSLKCLVEDSQEVVFAVDKHRDAVLSKKYENRILRWDGYVALQYDDNCVGELVRQFYDFREEDFNDDIDNNGNIRIGDVYCEVDDLHKSLSVNKFSFMGRDLELVLFDIVSLLRARVSDYNSKKEIGDVNISETTVFVLGDFINRARKFDALKDNLVDLEL